MTAATPPEWVDRGHSPNAERLRVALGWDRLPEMTDQEREEFDAAIQRAWDEARRFYGDPAA